MCYPFNDNAAYPYRFRDDVIAEIALAREKVLECLSTGKLLKKKERDDMATRIYCFAFLEDKKGRRGLIRILIRLSEDIYEHQLAVLEGKPCT